MANQSEIDKAIIKFEAAVVAYRQAEMAHGEKVGCGYWTRGVAFSAQRLMRRRSELTDAEQVVLHLNPKWTGWHRW